jgi:hypothetical protein
MKFNHNKNEQLKILKNDNSKDNTNIVKHTKIKVESEEVKPCSFTERNIPLILVPSNACESNDGTTEQIEYVIRQSKGKRK